MNYLQALMNRVINFQETERKKRAAEEEAFQRAMVENAEYIAGLNTLPFGDRLEGE